MSAIEDYQRTNRQGSFAPSSGGPVANGFRIFGDYIGSMWNRISGVTENREYNERLQQQQNAYNSPSAQRARMLAAGFSDSAVASYLAGNSGTVGNQPAVAPREGSQGGSLLQLLGSFLGLGEQVAGIGNVAADTGLKVLQQGGQAVQNELGNVALAHAEDTAVAQLRGLVLSNDGQEIKNAIDRVAMSIAESTESDEIRARQAQLALVYFEGAPYMNVTPEELQESITRRLDSTFDKEKGDKSAAEEYAELQRWRADHVNESIAVEDAEKSAKANAARLSSYRSNQEYYTLQVAREYSEKWKRNYLQRLETEYHQLVSLGKVADFEGKEADFDSWVLDQYENHKEAMVMLIGDYLQAMSQEWKSESEKQEYSLKFWQYWNNHFSDGFYQELVPFYLMFQQPSPSAGGTGSFSDASRTGERLVRTGGRLLRKF